MIILKKLINSILFTLGYRIHKTRNNLPPNTIFGDLLPQQQIVDIEKIALCSDFIPGMTDSNEGKLLFVLAASQCVSGDIVEIGSWQGKSSSFLARAIQISENGKFFAIDNFLGNINSKEAYIVNQIDLSDLESNFKKNMSSLGLQNHVKLISKDVTYAARKLLGHKIRFLFIDGDHSYDGVKRDYSLFKNQLTEDAIVVFDDFDSAREGLVLAIKEFIEETNPKVKFQMGKLLVLIL